MRNTYLLTDLDNTLYDWVDYYAPSLRAMVHALSRELHVDEDAVYDEFKAVFAGYPSLEYPYVVQKFRICQQMSQAEIDRLVHIAQVSFTRTRNKNLTCYDGVIETLVWLEQGGVSVVGVTNAPFYQAWIRLRQLGLSHLFAGVAGWVGIETSSDKYRAISAGRQRTWRLSKDELKPSVLGYERIIADMAIGREEFYVIGDSMMKDVLPGMRVGGVGVWARYGQKLDRRNFETVLRVTPWDEQKIAEAYRQGDALPDFVVGSFSELRGIIRAPQMSLFG